MSNEYEREPVPESAFVGFRGFAGQYAGEHTAGTELMIGPLFVAAGVSAFDLLAGLLVGNILAILSWTFLTAPIATRARLTLYYQLERICGRRLVTIYNGVPYDLPLGIELYNEEYVSPVPARTLPGRQRQRILDHQLRSKGDAADLVRQIERGSLDEN